jgi:integrase
VSTERPAIQDPGCATRVYAIPEATRTGRGFFRRTDLERLAAVTNPKTEKPLLPGEIADVVTFLFFCPWRVGAARRLEWRDYSEADRALTLRAELNKTGYECASQSTPRTRLN